MILTAFVKRQLGTMAVLTALALGLMVFVYARIPASMGVGVYNVKAQFTDASGLYPKALVTFHGVKVGEVTSLDLTPTVAVANLRLSSGTAVPSNVVAQLHSTSAIGEQYVDLVVPPAGAAAGDLKDGTVLTPDRTVAMPQITPVLDSLNHLLQSVPLQATTDVLNQVNTGLGSEGPKVGQLIDSASSLVQAAHQQIAGTTGLIQALQPVLAVQQQLAPQTVSSVTSLDQFTQQLAAKDADLRALLSQAPGSLDQVSAVVGDLTKSLPSMLQNLSVTGTVLHTYLPQLQQILITYPAMVGRVQSTVNPRAQDGDVQLDLRAGLNNPPSCSTGYLPASDRRDPTVASVRPVNPLAYCNVAPSNPSSVRGERNLPCPNSTARGPFPSSCGLTFGSGIWPFPADASAASVGAGQPVAASTSTDTSWQQLFLQPLGLG